MLALAGVAKAQTPAPLVEADAPTIGYASAQAALEALRARKDVTLSVQNGWTIAADPAGPTLWSFPPKEHAAYPSAVRRDIQNRPDGVYVRMSVHCEASKAACDDLVRAFQLLNEQMARSLKGR